MTSARPTDTTFGPRTRRQVAQEERRMKNEEGTDTLSPGSREEEPSDVIIGSAPVGVGLEIRGHHSGRTTQPARALYLPVHRAAQRVLLEGFENPCTDCTQ